MRKNIPLIIGLAIPVVMIVFIFVAIYVPYLFANPKYSFVFSINESYYNDYGDHYSVVGDSIVKTTVPYPKDQNPKIYADERLIKLFVYDAEKDNVYPITFEETQKLKVNVSTKSPDGYILDYGNNNNGIFEIFGSSRDYNAWYLKKGIISKKIYSTNYNDPYGYRGHRVFLGWIMSGYISPNSK